MTQCHAQKHKLKVLTCSGDKTPHQWPCDSAPSLSCSNQSEQPGQPDIGPQDTRCASGQAWSAMYKCSALLNLPQQRTLLKCEVSEIMSSDSTQKLIFLPASTGRGSAQYFMSSKDLTNVRNVIVGKCQFLQCCAGFQEPVICIHLQRAAISQRETKHRTLAGKAEQAKHTVCHIQIPASCSGRKTGLVQNSHTPAIPLEDLCKPGSPRGRHIDGKTMSGIGWNNSCKLCMFVHNLLSSIRHLS